MARSGDVVGGKYRLVHPLGIGGMGAVWRAEHVALKQSVAIKLLDARGPQAERAIMRFQREAQIAASIRHRNVVYISDFGAGREPYLVMELLSGVPLSERLVVGEPLSVGLFLRIVDEVLQGLSAVHAAGVVHRDLKPDNIFLVRDSDGTLFPKLLDFGVSRSTEHGQGHTITREGVVMGTPEYVSPEHARGRPADARGDLYGLGVVMYEALSGRLPFQADNPADLIVAMLNAQLVPLLSFRFDLGREISDLVGKAMARAPEDRFQSSEEMRQAVCALLEKEGAFFDTKHLPRRFVSPTPEPEEEATAGLSSAALFPTESVPTGATERSVWLRRLVTRSFSATGAVAGLVVTASVLLLVPFFGSPEGEERGKVHAAPVPASPEPPLQQALQMELPAQVEVRLSAVPEGAAITVDGTTMSAPVFSLERDTGSHSIRVEADGFVPFEVMHDSAQGGEYAVVLEPVPAAKTRRRARRRQPSARRRARRTPSAPPAGRLVRSPDF